MPDLSTVLTSALVAAVVSGVIGPILLFFLHRGEDRRRQGFEVRFREYRKYLLSLEDMSSIWEDKALGFLQIAKGSFEAVIREEGDPNQHLVNLHNSLAGLTTELLSSFAPIKKELTGLRLVCSRKLLTLVDQFVTMHDELARDLNSRIKNWKDAGFAGSPVEGFDEPVRRAEGLRKRIFEQMRKELRFK